MIELRNIKRRYGSLEAVNGVSLEIPDSSIFGIIGRSGAGKSTLLRLMSLLEPPDSGEIYINRDRVDNLSDAPLLARRRRHGMIFQNFNLFYSRNVSGNIAYPLEIIGAKKEETAERIKYLLELVDLSGKSNSPISKLSGGQKQRVAIARALAASPEILFCDEATSALDPQTTLSILNLLKDIRSKLGITIVLITHQMDVVRTACDKLAVLSEGEVLETGSVKEIFSHPHSDFTKELLTTLRVRDSEVFGNEYLRKASMSLKAQVYRLLFNSENTVKPIISQLAKKFSLEVNILYASFNVVDADYVGEMFVSIAGDTEEFERAQGYLKNEGVVIEYRPIESMEQTDA